MGRITKLEDRYVVIKRRDMQAAYEDGAISIEEIRGMFDMLARVAEHRVSIGKPKREHIVVANNNPCYQDTLKATLDWINRANQPASPNLCCEVELAPVG